jgi:23S rRNA G2445 N2-methylase RlmL
MKQEIEENLERKIKKNIYGKAQTAKVIFPAGLGTVALDEIKSILENLWFPQKFQSECSLLKNEILIDNIHMFALSELMMRSQCISDIRLIIFEGKAIGKEAFEKQCRNINWNFFVNKKMSLKIKVDSVASKAFHETGLKEILSKILKEHISDILSGENTDETTCLYADLYKDKLTVSISLAGDLLYKRGYRGTLSASAPLREDAASSCIQKSMQFAKKINEKFSPNTIMIPFSGTGTFAFEFLQSYLHFSPALFGRDYALQKMPLFRQENFNFLLKKAKENCLFKLSQNENPTPISNKDNIKFICIDNSKNANSAFLENVEIFKNAVIKNDFHFSNEIFSQNRKSKEPFYNDNFLKMDIDNLITSDNKKFGNIFIPLNPPYGIRLGGNSDSVALYKNIASKLNEISKLTKKEHKNLLGFILCPSEETWSAFCRNLTQSEVETYHFTQGGMDIRVCQFYV